MARGGLPLLLACLLACACAGSGRYQEVQFTAPPQPDPALRPFLADADRIGVLTATNIEPYEQLDIEKVMARLSGALTRQLARLPGVTVVPEEEIEWKVEGIQLDTATVVSPQTRQALMDTLDLDALVVVELQRLEARVTPMAPTPYGLAPNPGLDMMVGLRLSVVNLRTGRDWRQSGQQRNWQPVRLQVFGGNQGEQQLLQSLGQPLERFLVRLAPPPRTQVRQFEVSGD
ncbi:MAG: hypothetical protein AB1505_05395 [Candidatus Latescibacterota bacterium]